MLAAFRGSTQSRCHERDLVVLSPQTKLQAPQIEIWNTINQCNFYQISMSSPPCTNVKPPAQTQSPPIDDFLATVLGLRIFHSKNVGEPI